MKKTLLTLLLAAFLMPLIAQDEPAREDAATEEAEGTDDKESKKVKTGWFPGPLPTTSYDADQGFKYGALLNLYHYGDGSRYPMYDHNLYFEFSRTTKGTGINQFSYDSDRLIPGIRSFIEASLLTEQGLDFYGFNGYQSVYDFDTYEKKISDDVKNPERMFYRHSRRLIRIKADFQGKIQGNKFRWLGGIAYYNNKIDNVDTLKFNDGNSNPITGNSLYQNYVDWGVIEADQENGGAHTLIKGGLIFDTRDNEPNPYSGIWTEMQLHYAPSFLSNTNYGYTRLVLTHRQYFTIIPDWISLAARISYQGKLTGEMPYYMLPYLFNTAPKLTTDGVGGSKTTRGVMRNRIVGDGFAFANIEVRGKVLKTKLFKQDFYIALSAFLDGGMVTQKYALPENLLTLHPEAAPFFDMDAKEIPHLGYGGGVHLAMNENFIVTVDTGWAVKETDGVGMNLYINLNFLY